MPTLTNNVSAVSDTDQTPDTDSETTTVETPIGPVSDLSISKDDQSEPVLAGENVTYDITVTNNGPSVATNVRVLELVPAGTTALSLTASNPDADDEDCSLGGSCYLGTMQVGTVATITVVLQVNPDFQGSSLTNTASVSADQADDDPSDNIASDDTAITTEADLSIEKVDLTDPVIAGEVLLYQIQVTNNGPSDAQNVVISDTIPTESVFVGASPGCSEISTGLVECTFPVIPAGHSESVLLEVRVNAGTPDGTTIYNNASVSSDTDDPDDGNNTTVPTETIANQDNDNPTDLVISKQASSDPVTAGENLTYYLTVTNNGPAVASNVQVVDALPSGVTLVSADASQGICNNGITCDLGDLAVSASAYITIVVTVDSDQLTAINNVARVSASNPDPVPDNEANVITQVETSADLDVTKSADPSVATPGASLSYEILVSNSGPSAAENVQVVDNYPEALNNVVVTSSNGTCSLNPLLRSSCL